MRTKEEILTLAREDISHPTHRVDAHLWLEFRKIEVLIDIRDIIELRACQIIGRLAALSKYD